LVEFVSFSEQELDIIISLVPAYQMCGSISYNAQLDLLYKKKLEAMIQIPGNTTFEKISKVMKLYKPLFIVRYCFWFNTSVRNFIFSIHLFFVISGIE
jgi:hypothetical protein